MTETKKGIKVTVSQLGLVLSAVIWVMGVLIVGYDHATFNGWMLILVYLFAIGCVFKANDRKTYPFVVFLVYCMLSNAGQTLTELLGISNETNVDIYARYSEHLIGEMLLLQGAFIVFMTFGYLAFRRTRDLSAAAHKWSAEDDRKIGLEEILLFAVAAIVAVTYLVELSKRASLSYGDYYYESREGLGTVMQYVYHVVIFSYLMRHKGRKRIMAYVILVALAVMAIFIGSRSVLIPLLVGCIFIMMMVHRGQMKLKARYVIFAILLLWILAGFTEIRDHAISELNFKILLEIFTVSPFRALINVIQEMGGSARTVLATLNGINGGAVSHDGTIIYSLLKGIFPVGILDRVGIEPPVIESLSEWVSDFGGDPYVLSQGWGYSIIAELIYNFGLWGMLASFVIGALMAGLENLIEKLILKDHCFLASGVLYVLGYAVFWARAESSLISTRIRYTVYFAIMLWVFNIFRKKKRKGT